MKPVDPRLLRRAKPVRAFLAALAGIGTLDALLLVVQATLLADVVSRLVLEPRYQAPYTGAVAGLLAVSAGRAALAWAREACAVRTSTAVKAALRGDLVRSLITGPVRAADRERTGELTVLATRGIDALDGYFARYLPQLVLAALVPAVLGARVLAADPLSTLIIAVTVPLIPLFMALIGLMTRDHLARRWSTLERLGGHFLEVVAGLPTLVAFGRARGQEAAIRRAADAHRRATTDTLRVAFLSSLVLELIAMLSVALVAVTVGLRLADGTLTLRTGLLVLICAPEVYLPLRQVGARYHEAAEGLAATDRVFALTAPQTRRSADSGRAPLAAIASVPRLPGVIRFDGVRIARDGRPAQTVPDVQFPLVPGRATALAGPSGAGKSTLLHLMLGFDVPSAGRITVGGADLADMDIDAWRAQIAWVPQNPRLTGRTAADAIRIGRPDATDDEVAHAAAAAGIDFPLDAPLGRDGTALSGGQARRVALARAILRDAPIVLLDEPTEHLDTETESSITASLRAWLPGRTALLITHRPALLELCDTVVRLRPAGRVPLPTPTVPAETRGAAADRPDDPTEPKHVRARILTAIGLGGGAALCGVGLAASSAWLITTAALRPPLLTLQVGIAAVQAFGIGRAALRYAERLAGHDATLRLLADLRVRVYRGLLRRAPAAMAAARGGDLLAKLTADIDAAQDLFLKVALPVAAAALSCAGLLAFDVIALPASAAVLGAGILVGGVLAPFATRAASRSAGRRTATEYAELTEHTVSLLGALPDLIAYGAAPRLADRIEAADRRLTALERRGALAAGLGLASNVIAAGATCAALAAVSIGAVRAGQVSGPVAAALVLAPLALFELLAALPDAARALDRGRAGWNRLSSVANCAPLVPTPQAPRRLAWTSESVLEFDRVTAAWPDLDSDTDVPAADHADTRPAVSGVTFAVHAGDQVEVGGPSGAGKSTLAALATRCLDPRTGAVRIDGTDLRDADPDQVRTLVAVCGQDAHLFDTTIRENLRITRPDATDPELWRALAVVRLEHWIRTLPAGLDTRVGQLGDAVSGGERQRIALARILLSRAPVVLLDEPLAHLDTENAAMVERNLRRALEGRTVVWIRHRLDGERRELGAIQVLRAPAAEPAPAAA